jgi:hypothetical protein
VARNTFAESTPEIKKYGVINANLLLLAEKQLETFH